MATVAPFHPPQRPGRGEERFDDPSYPAAEGLPAAEAAMDLRGVLNTVWRRKGVVLATVLVCGLLAFLGLMQATPLYVAGADVVVEVQQERAINFQDVLQGGSFDHTTTRTESAVLTSREMAERVIDRLGLMQHPYFNPTIPDPNRPRPLLDLRGLAKDLTPQWLLDEYRRVRDGEVQRPLTPEEREAQLRQNAIDLFVGSVSALAGDLSRVISIQFTAPDPELAARVANALAEAYIEQTVRRKFEAIERAGLWLNEQADGLRARLQESRRRWRSTAAAPATSVWSDGAACSPSRWRSSAPS